MELADGGVQVSETVKELEGAAPVRLGGQSVLHFLHPVAPVTGGRDAPSRAKRMEPPKKPPAGILLGG